MKRLHIALFGKLSIQYDGRVLAGCEASKVQELFCYLLTHRDRPHTREMLASLLWGSNCTTSQSKKYLRNALWRIHVALNAQFKITSSGLLLVEPGWIQLRSIAELWLDVAVFEAVYASVKGVVGCNLDGQSAKALEDGVRLYRGDLLEDCYSDWCLCERERLLHIYLNMLDKLMEYCETHHKCEMGLSFGDRILQHDRARERTHQQMIRLHYLNGNRTGALRQYQRCVAALKEELDIGPSPNTTALYEQVRADRLPQPTAMPVTTGGDMYAVREVLTCLQQLQAGLAEMQQQVQRATKAAELVLGNRLPFSRKSEESDNRRWLAADEGTRKPHP